jgi:hypothetical protein
MNPYAGAQLDLGSRSARGVGSDLLCVSPDRNPSRLIAAGDELHPPPLPPAFVMIASPQIITSFFLAVP